LRLVLRLLISSAPVVPAFGQHHADRCPFCGVVRFCWFVLRRTQPDTPLRSRHGGAADFGLACPLTSRAGGCSLSAPWQLAVVSAAGLRHYPWLYNYSFKPKPLRGSA